MRKSFLCSDRFLHDEISNFTIEMTQQCNFRCSYCCFSGEYEGMRKHTGKSIDMEVMNDTIEFIKTHASKVDNVVVSFFGGEALLQLNKVLYMMEKLYAIFENRIVFDISTNGLLLTDEAIDKLMLYDVGISVSLDGCRTIHDNNRKNINGGGTYDQIVANLLRFKERYPEEYQKRIRLLITVGTLEDIIVMNDNFCNFKELLGDKPPFISHIYPNFGKGKLYENSVEKEKEFLDKAVEYKQKGEQNFYTIILDDLLKKAKKLFECDENCAKIHLRTCLDSMYSIFIDVEGRLYPCEKFDMRHVIGNVNSGIDKKLLYKWAVIYNLRRSALCGNCGYVEYCTRCLADLKMSFSENRQMCEQYKNNIELALFYNKIISNNA